MASDRRRERAEDDLEGDEEEDDRSHRPRVQSSVITILEAFVIERTGGVDEARNMIQSIIDCGDTRHYQVQLRNSAECLMFKATTKKVSKKASEMLAKAKAKGGFPDALVKVGPILYTFARHFIVKKTIVNPSISFGAIIMAMMRYVCNKRRIISPQWFQLFQGKVWDSLQRFCTAVKFDRLTFFYQVISSNGDQLVCGAMESFSILHKTQPLIGRSAAIGNPEKRKVTYRTLLNHILGLNLLFLTTIVDVFNFKTVLRRSRASDEWDSFILRFRSYSTLDGAILR